MTQNYELVTYNGVGGELVTAGASGLMAYNPAAVYLASLAPGSRPAMQRALDVIAHLVSSGRADAFTLPWGGLRYQHTAAIRRKLAEDYAHSTANKMLSALRGVLRAAWQLGQMTAEDYHTAASVKAVKGQTVPAGRHVPAGEVLALLATCDQSRAGIRDAAIIALLYGAGLRRAELVSLNRGDYDQAAGVVKVKGKGNKQRVVPVPGGAVDALADWLAVHTAGSGDAVPLFHGLGNRSDGGRLTTQAVFAMLKKRADAAGIPSLSPHDFRRTFAGELLARGADISTVSKLMGHSSVNITARYDRRDDKAKRAAVDLLHVPYQKRVLTSGK